MDKKTLVVFGSGGHGWESIKHYIDSFDGEVTIAMLPVDWGGSTGTIGRILKLNNGELNNILHGEANYPILPFGDMNKFVMAYLLQKCPSEVMVEFRDEKINALDYRSDSIHALKRVFESITACLGISNTFKEKFLIYLHTYLEYYLEHKDLVSSPCTTSLGNLWHSFLYFELGGVDGLMRFYHENSVIPWHINLMFSSSTRQVLRGRYYNEQQHEFYLDGEDEIDTADFPIDPESFDLIPSHDSQTKVLHLLIEKLKQADMIIIPNGSIANWLPLLNDEQVLRLLKEKSLLHKIIWVMNLFHSKNEYPFDVYFHYLSTQGIYPIIIGPDQIPADYYVSFLKLYQKEGKTLNYNFNTQSHTGVKLKQGFNNCLDVVTAKEDPRIEGLKYEKNYLKDVLMKYLDC
jgi:hypothetical protein